MKPTRPDRPGAVVPMAAIMLAFVLIMVAFAIDIGYVSYVKAELQTAADASALAAASQIADRSLLRGQPTTTANLDAAARTQAVRIAGLNKAGGVTLRLNPNHSNSPTGDLVLGRIAQPNNPASPFQPGVTPYNSAFVRIRRDNQANDPLRVFFGGFTNRSTFNLNATATATLSLGVRGFEVNANTPNSLLLPFTLDIHSWNSALSGNGPDIWSYNPQTLAYSSGADGIKEIRLYPTGTNSPGNFGTVDIGSANNSTNDLVRQILHGPNAKDFSYLGGKLELGSNGSVILEGDTGLSAAVKTPLEAIRGQKRVIPIYEPPVVGNGNNARFKIIAFVGIVVLDVKLTGNPKFVTIQPEFVSDPTAFGTPPAGNIQSTVVYPLSLTR